jgi:hypothetical protein
MHIVVHLIYLSAIIAQDMNFQICTLFGVAVSKASKAKV